MIIRDIEEKDINDILSLIRAKADFDGCLDSLQSKESEIQKAFFSSNPKAKAIVAETEGNIYSTFIAKPGIWLDDLYVYKEYRKTGGRKRANEKPW